MDARAVDIVLFPPLEVRQTAVSLNQELLEKFGGEIRLSEEGMIPHISLAMGTLNEAQLPAAQIVLNECAKQFPPLMLEVSQLHVRQSSKGHAVSSLDIAPSASLKALHAWLVGKFDPLLGRDATPEMFHSSPVVSASSVEWVNRYLEDYTHENFWPHITLGMGTLDGQNMRMTFAAGRVAVCHLGNHCTCREILAEAILKGRG